MPTFVNQLKLGKTIFHHFSRSIFNYILFGILIGTRCASRHFYLQHKLMITHVNDYSCASELTDIASHTLKLKLYYLFTQFISDLLFVPLFAKLSVDTIDLVVKNVLEKTKIESKNGYLQICVSKGTKGIGLMFRVVVYLLINHVINLLVGASQYSFDLRSLYIIAAVLIAAILYVTFSFLLFYNKTRINKIHKQVNRTVSDALNNLEVINVSNGEESAFSDFKKYITRFCIKLGERNILKALITFIVYLVFSSLVFAINMYSLTNDTEYTAKKYRETSVLVRNWEEIIMGVGSFYLAYKAVQADVFLLDGLLDPPRKNIKKEILFDILEVELPCNKCEQRIQSTQQIANDCTTDIEAPISHQKSFSKITEPEEIDEMTVELVPNSTEINLQIDDGLLNTRKHTFKTGDLVCLIDNDQLIGKKLLNSLLGFDINEHPIRINSKNIEDYTLNDLRGTVNLLPEQKCIFNLSVRENLDYSNSNDKSLLINLFKLPELTSPCGENGSLISGGEKQKICLIRFLSDKRPVMLMDEPFGSLDFDSQKVLMDYLNENMKDVLVIANMKECKFSEQFSKVIRL